jgi:hypothetical protein
MTPREIANLCCRLMAIYALFQGLAFLPSLAALIDPLTHPMDLSTAELFSRVLWAMHPAVMIAAAAFLWRWSPLVASWMVGHDIQDAVAEPESTRRKATLRDVHGVAFSVIGLWVLVHAAQDIAGHAFYLVYDDPTVTGNRWVGVYGRIVVQLALGIWLLFGARGLVDLLHRARRVGLDAPELDEPDKDA